MRAEDAVIYPLTQAGITRRTSKAVAIDRGLSGRLLLMLLVIVSRLASTSLEAQSPFANKAAAQYELSNIPATQITASSEAGINRRNEHQQDGWTHSWLHAVNTARASQPHFIAPMVTTHVMLVQQYRYDMSRQQDSLGHTSSSNYGASRGLEIIPATRLEVGISPPSYIAHQSNQKDGVGDLAWQVKFRAFSAPEHKGDYFVGFFMGGSFPVGAQPSGAGHTILSPTFAAAKGLGPWDIQSTVGANLPMSGTSTLGRTIIFNTAVNYRIKGMVWPMLEQNSTFWSSGPMDGKKQVFLTPGVILGSIPLENRLRIAIGGGVQTAVTPYHQYNHRWVFSVRFPF